MLNYKAAKPTDTLNKFSKTFANQPIALADIVLFQQGLTKLWEKLATAEDVNQDEEAIKTLFSDFLKEVWYKDYNVNNIDKIDVAIHNGQKATDPIAVLLEAKRTSNKAESPKKDNLNTKALHELLLYYLRQRSKDQNQIRHLVITNGWEWYIIDEKWFDTHCWGNKKLKADYERYEQDTKKTHQFYNDIANPFFDGLEGDLEFTYFNLKDYQSILGAPETEVLNKKDKQPELTAIYKVLSPQFLLRIAVANDSNTLNKEFYQELLHIMGLEEQKDGNKIIIGRLPVGKRHPASFLELTLAQLAPIKGVGLNDESKFEIALDLIITWVNRVLFLKLLEAHQLQINNGDAKFKFLNYDKIKSFDWLKALFFDVLAKKLPERVAPWTDRFPQVPYLNSSLYEPTDNEKDYLHISEINDRESLALHTQTVLTEGNKLTKKQGSLDTLDYFFQFLDAYDFGAEPGEADVRSDVKTLINASVLGLIFEKINGYKEGSIYTPGYITMYMCRETIRRAIVQKFTEKYNWKIDEFDDIPNLMGRGKKEILEYNQVVNSLTIADPAVGSGHFLVSALNELLACKSELGILADSTGKRFNDWHVQIENDELLLYNNDSNELFRYKRHPETGHINPERQSLMETLFQEKRNLIEGSLFGVDINSNSVKICRLRLWIELLKNAYYKQGTTNELETLPNIDINIKVGNSLVSKFGLQEDLSEVFSKQKFKFQTYKDTVQNYKRAPSLEARAELMAFIRTIKEEFKQTISLHDPKRKKLYDLKGKIQALESWVPGLFGVIENEEETRNANLAKFKSEAEKLDQELNDAISQKLYANAFEWRFEFPEVLDEKGNFVGFDVVIGNPPYVLLQNSIFETNKSYFQNSYKTASYKIDTYHLFYELACSINKNNGIVNFITPNTFLKNKYSNKLRKFIRNNYEINKILNFSYSVFNNASVDVLIMFLTKTNNSLISTLAANIFNQIEDLAKTEFIKFDSSNFTEIAFSITNTGTSDISITSKIDSVELTIGSLFRAYFGLQTFDRTKFVATYKIDDRYKPTIDGTNINRYYIKPVEEYVLFEKDAIKSGGNFQMYNIKRVVVRQIGAFPQGSIADAGVITLNTAYNLVPLNKEANYSLTLLGILNSRTIKFYWIKNNSDNKKTFPKIKKQPLESIPIPNVNESIGLNITTLVTQILAAKEINPNANTSALEQEIDQIVYQLYNLTDEEIAIVEANT